LLFVDIVMETRDQGIVIDEGFLVIFYHVLVILLLMAFITLDLIFVLNKIRTLFLERKTTVHSNDSLVLLLQKWNPTISTVE